MPKPPKPPPPPRRHPPALARERGSKAVARMRRALIRNRGGDGGDRPDYLAYLTAHRLWIDDVDWTTATDAEVIARTQAGDPPEPPRDDAEGRRLTDLILRRLDRLAEASTEAEPGPDARPTPRGDAPPPDAA